MLNLFQTEPAVVVAGVGAIVEAAFLVAIAFGLPITPDEKLALGGLGSTIITVVTGIVTRSQVTPTASLAAPAVTPVIPPAPPVVLPPHG